jgi:geranylgeranylglycerol-phosphate geranylgeranyltransferase
MLGGYLAGSSPLDSAVVRAAAVVLLIVSFGNVVNDCADVDVDSHAKPDRPLPSGAFSVRQAHWLAAALTVASLCIATTLGVLAVELALGAILLAGAYSWALKDTLLLGNAAVAALDASIVFYGALAAGRLSTLVTVIGALTLLHVFGQEVLFNLEDESGDRAAGLRTTATRLGPTRTLAVYRALAVLFIAAVVLPGVMSAVPPQYLYAAIPCIVFPMIGVLATLTLPLTPHKLRRAGWLTRVVWLSGLLPVLMFGR